MADDTWSKDLLENPGTVLGYIPEAPRSAISAKDAFIVAYDRLAGLGRIAKQRAMIAVAVDARSRVVEGVVIEDRTTLVMGRHSRCGLRLPAESISLRHLLALVRFEGQSPVTRLWDLNTEQPFLTEDMSTNAAVVAEGPIFVMVGEYSVWFIPSTGVGKSGWPDRAEDAWGALPDRCFIDRRAPGVRRPERLIESRAAGIHDEITMITSVRSPLLLGDDEPEIAWGEVRVASGTSRWRRRISAERLERGVLVGRYDRCGLLVANDTHVSRVHLLLVRIDREVWAIDTGSTNGIFKENQVFEAAVLDDSATLYLGEVTSLAWERIVHAEA